MAGVGRLRSNQRQLVLHHGIRPQTQTAQGLMDRLLTDPQAPRALTVGVSSIPEVLHHTPPRTLQSGPSTRKSTAVPKPVFYSLKNMRL